MIKEAILVKGEPIIYDDVETFHKNASRDLRIISNLALSQGYNVQNSSLEKMVKKVKNVPENTDEFLFYYVGHSNESYVGTLDYETSGLLDEIGKVSGKKIIIFDSCSGEFPQGKDFSGLDFPIHSKVLGAKEIYPSKSLAKLIYDASLRGKNFDGLTKKTFEDMKHNWVYFKEN